jgi:hypothetical protein
MTQADSVHSTPPTNTSAIPAQSSRRTFLAQAAGGAALGAGLPLPAPAATPDPINAAIERHRAAYATMQAVFAEHTRAHELADAKVGPSHLDIPSMVDPGKTVEASCWWDIERAVPSKEHPDLYQHYCDALIERTAARAAIIEPLIGDEDEATNEVAGPEFEALQEFAETTPTTLKGLLAMVAYGWLEVECYRCKTRASIPLDAIRRPRDTPIWKLEAGSWKRR